MKALTATKTHRIDRGKSENLPGPQFPCLESDDLGTSLVHWLRCHTSNAGGAGLIPGRGTKIPHAARCTPKKQSGDLEIHWHLPNDISQNTCPKRCPKQKKFQVK